MKLDGVVAVGGTAAAVQTRRRQSWMPAAFVAALALACRLGYWLCLTPSRVLTSDAAQYNGLAANLARGRGYVDTFPQLALHPTAFRPPLYPTLLALFYWPLGVHPGLGRAINVVIGTLVVAVAYLVVRRHAGRTAALGTGIALAIAPNLIANDTYVLNEPLALLLLLLLIDSVLRRRWLLAGLLTGALTLTRPSAQYLALLIAIWLLLSVGWRRAAGYVAVAALVVSPWVVRNWVQLHSPLLVTSNGFNMAAMYSPPAQRIGAFIDPLQDPYFTFMRFDQFDEVAWDKHLERIGEDNLAHHPTLLAKVTARNAAALFELKPSFNRNAEARDGRDLTARDATLWLFYATTIVGIAGLWLGRRRTMTPLLILVAAYFTLASLVFVAPPRLRAPIDLVLAVGVGLFLDEVARRRRSGAGRVDSATIAGRDRPPLAAAVGG